MATANQIAKQVVQAYKSVKILRQLTKAKFDRLKESNTLYALFKNPPPHPYETLVENGDNLVIKFENFVAAMHDKTMISGVLRSELEKLKEISIAKDEDYSDIAELLKIPIAPNEKCTVDQIGEQLLMIFEMINLLLLQSSEKWASDSLGNDVSKKNIKSHFEKPFLNTIQECRLALSNTKKIAKMLLDQKIDASTIRNELSQIRTMRLLSGLGDSEELRKLVVLV